MRSLVRVAVMTLLAAAACGGEGRYGGGDARRMVRVRPEDVAPSPSPAPASPAVAASPPLRLPDPPGPQSTPGTGALPDLAALYAAAAPSVVALEVRTVYGERQGTGFFIDPLGRVLTSAHVVEDTVGITAVTVEGRRLTARVVGADPGTDLALLTVDGEDLPRPLPLATREAQVGEWVMTIGTPLGLAFSATRGIVSATGRSDVAWDPAVHPELVQTDAAINRGNSGGPLLGMDGAVLGVCAATDPEADRIGFAVPSSTARIVAVRLHANITNLNRELADRPRRPASISPAPRR